MSEGYKSEAIEAPNCLGLFYNDEECEDCMWREECREEKGANLVCEQLQKSHENTERG